MKNWKIYQISLFVALCIFLNYAGRMLALRLQLPLWLDSFGTVLCAAIGGPVCGSIVGAACNVIYGMANHVSYIYGLASIALAVVVGFAARRGAFKSMFGTLTVSAIAALASIVISLPLDIIFLGGSTGNLWGDGVLGRLQETGVPAWLGLLLGEFYVNFLDKLLTLLLLYAVLRLLQRMAAQRKREIAAEQPADLGGKALSVALALILCGGALACSPARAEASVFDDYVQTIFASHNGLPCGEANDIAQTNDGILWIGTYAGLYRYNGQEFRWMDGYDSVHNVNCLFVDAEGRLWIGTNDNGLSIVINEQIANVLDQSTGLPSNSVRSIIQSSDGYYYVGTTSSMQVLTLNSGLKRVTTLREVNYADHAAADDAGHVAVVTADGRLFLLQGGKILSSLQADNRGEIFQCCCFDPQGRLLAGSSSNRIYVYDISGGYFQERGTKSCGSLSSLNDLSYLSTGELFVSADNGVGYLDARDVFHGVNTNDFNNSIDNMLVDYQGNLWFTSSRLGLLRLAPSSFKDVYSTIGMSSRVVNAVTKWQGDYYFGTDKGLDVVDAQCKNRVVSSLAQSLSGVRIRCLLTDSAESLWVCTYGSGLLEVTPDGGRYLYNADNGSFGDRARLVTELKDGTILAAGDTGISFIRDHRIQKTIGYADGLINSMILTITEMPDGRILAGTDGDGIAVLEGRQVTKMLTREDGLSSGVILRTIPDERAGGVFIVTSNGLCYMDADYAIRPLNNFPYFNNYDIWVENEETLFVMSSAGIYVVDREELLSGTEPLGYDLLDSRRGLNSAITANSWPYYDGETDLFLPCDQGVFIIDTESYTAGTHTYRMTVTSVRLDGVSQQIERSSPIQIGRGVKKVEIVPEIINYTIQDPNVGYCLEGFDHQWTILPRSSLGTVVYTNLPAGTYSFHLAVFDNSLENILEERAYKLEKEEEFYDHPWFTLYMLLVPMVAVAWFTWFVVRTQVQRTLNIQRRELALAHQQIQMGNETIFAIAKAVDAKDERTSQHSYRVSQYSVMIAREMGFSEEECENLRKAAMMHDIGKIGIPDNILNKPARLTDEEYAVMKSHVVRGAEILKDFTLIDHVVEGALHHHERYDGRGYPSGLKGEEIPLYGRIIGVADAFDAMTANRVYRKQMDFDYVLNEMRKGRGTQFDPQAVDILLKLIDDGKIDLNQLYSPKPEEQ